MRTTSAYSKVKAALQSGDRAELSRLGQKGGKAPKERMTRKRLWGAQEAYVQANMHISPLDD